MREVVVEKGVLVNESVMVEKGGLVNERGCGGERWVSQ